VELKMKIYENKAGNLAAFVLDPDHWDDFVRLFGERGACGGCWCMSWRRYKADFDTCKGESNKLAMKELVDRHQPVGVLLYLDKQPIGWCAAAPREVYLRLEKSRVFRRPDSLPVWSISCFFIDQAFRRKGYSLDLIRAVLNFCRMNGAETVEAYPQIPYSAHVPGAFLWTGVPSVFEKAGFHETVRRSKWKRMMRRSLDTAPDEK
jgi:GNAT superfamily N-acetyltransferase